MKLTAVQVNVLVRIYRHGIVSAHKRTLKALCEKGLITYSEFYGSFYGVKITEKGKKTINEL